MKIVVISLPTSLDRRAHVIEKLSGRNLDFEFLDAIDGRIDDHPYLRYYDEKSYMLNRCRKAAPGELGCYVSHYLAWEKCLALNEPIVVLEDDFELTDDFEEGLNFVKPYLDKVAFIRLERLKAKHYLKSGFKNHKFSLVKQLKAAMCTTGYVITPKAAKVFITKGKVICAPVDLFIRHVLIHKQLIYALIPHVIYPTHANSIIGFHIRTQKEKGLVLKTRRFFHKWTYTIGNVAVNLINSLVKS